MKRRGDMKEKSGCISSQGISRRRFIASAGVVAAAIGFTPHRLFAEKESLVVKARKNAATANITVQALRGGVSALIGSGGNIAVFPESDGKFIVDSGYAGSRDKIADALKRISHAPIAHLVNTHWHFDHTDGNEWMHTAGATITAHENTRKHLSANTRVDDWTLPSHPHRPAPFQPMFLLAIRRFA
jgi:glyoxylase-like metal-dependent hydrolase (beta-lactamase superfamily II)